MNDTSKAKAFCGESLFLKKDQVAPQNEGNVRNELLITANEEFCVVVSILFQD